VKAEVEVQLLTHLQGDPITDMHGKPTRISLLYLLYWYKSTSTDAEGAARHTVLSSTRPSCSRACFTALLAQTYWYKKVPILRHKALAGKPTLMTIKFETIAPTALQQKINLVFVYFSEFGIIMLSIFPFLHYSAGAY
jgi:hypothetical protein